MYRQHVAKYFNKSLGDVISKAASGFITALLFRIFFSQTENIL